MPPRIVKPAPERRREILEHAQALFLARGFARTSVRDIIDAVGIAKGTFYHHFGSKMDLLEALAEMRFEALLPELEHLVDAPEGTAADKLCGLFATINGWELANADLLEPVLEVFYRDDNVVLRSKLEAFTIDALTPLVARIVRQGVDEGVFDTDEPSASARLILVVSLYLAGDVAELMLGEPSADHLIRKVTFYRDTVERILGAARGSLPLFDERTLAQWLETGPERIEP